MNTGRIVGMILLICSAGACGVQDRKTTIDTFAGEYQKWRQEQLKILRINAESMNGLRPPPESNSKFRELRGLGARILPQLATELENELRGVPAQENSPESHLSFFIAYLIADIANWDLHELDDQKEPARFVLKKYKVELERDGWRNLRPPKGRDLDYWKKWNRPDDRAATNHLI